MEASKETTSSVNAKLPAHRSGLLLRLTADMFRQHSELYLKQAAVLERIASNPTDALSWQLEEPSPESVQDCLLQENAAALAVKGYQSMLQVQKRVDYLERLMMRNGVGRKAIVKSKGKADKKTKEDPFNPFHWFLMEHRVRVGDAMGQPSWSHQVRKSVESLWKNSNPAERKPYVEKAARAKRIGTVSIKGKDPTLNLKSTGTNPNVATGAAEISKDAKSKASLSDDDSSTDEDVFLFQKEPAKVGDLSESDDDS